MAAFSVIAGDRDITTSHDGLVMSNVDPGGFETLTCNPQAIAGLRAGARVTARLGGETVWDGRINEPGQKSADGRDTYQIAVYGYGAALKDNAYREIYVDRDLSRWGSPSTSRRLTLVAGSLNPVDASVLPDASSPSLLTEVTFDFTAAGRQYNEPVYDPGGIPLGSLYYAWQQAGTNPADAQYHWAAFLGTDDSFVSIDSSGELRAAGPGTGTVTATTTTRKVAGVQMYYGTAVSGFDGVKASVYWTVLAPYGTHGLPKRGTADFTQAQGFYPSDIALDAVGRAHSPILPGIVVQATQFIVLHSAYVDPTLPEQVVDDQAKLAGGWHWGVWEPMSVLDTAPRFWFTPPPAEATAVVSRTDCDELDPPKVRLDLLYNTCRVAYRDAAGTTAYVTVTLANPLLGETAIGSRTLEVNMGIGSSAAAQAYGLFALRLAQRAARGGGSVILPDTVSLPGGGRKPACLLKAGRDRLRISDLADAGSALETDTRRFDTFHVRRIETTITESGAPQTRCEFDDGADLMEVLQARGEIARILTGA